MYVLTAVFAVFFLIVVYNYRITRKIILEEVRRSAINLSQSTLYQIESVLLPPRKIPENLAALIENGAIDVNNLQNIMKMLVIPNDEIFGCCVAFEPFSLWDDKEFYAPYYYRSGDSLILKDLGENNYNYTTWDWYTLPREKGPCWGEPYFDEGGGYIMMITYSVPFFSTDGSHKFRGVVTVDLSIQKLSEMIRTLQVYETGYVFLISSTGKYISRSDSVVSQIDNIFSYAEKNNLPQLAGLAREMVSGVTGFRKYYSFVRNEDYYIFYAPVKSNHWSIAIVIPEKVILADMYSLHQRILLFGLIGFLIILITIVIISRKITTPLEKLAFATRLIGSGNFDAELPRIRSRDEIGQLSDSFLQMQGQLREFIRNLEEVTAARQKIEGELKIAYDIQQSIIPKTFPPFPQRCDMDIYASLVPALQVGGDLYDYFFVQDERLAFCIGDVSGKGIPASLTMAITRTLFRSRTRKKMNAREIVQEMNSDLAVDNNKAMFVTFFLGLLNMKTGELEYCNAGHNYPYILKKNGTFAGLKATHGAPLGVVFNRPYDHDKILLNGGDRIVLYTDGVTEAMDREGEIYGENRLEEILSGPCKEATVKETTQVILESIAEFTKGAEQSDDITLMVLSYGLTEQKETFQRAMKHKISIHNNMSELERLNAFLEMTGAEWDIAPELLFQLNLASEEVVSNIIRYGYKTKTARDNILVELALGDNHLKISFTDHGAEFNPLQVPPPDDLDKPARERKAGGLGIYLIRNLMDEVDYQRVNDCNILILTKKIPSSELQ